MNKNKKILFLIIILFFLVNYKAFVYEYNNLFGIINYNSGNYDKSIVFFLKNDDNYGKYNQANSFYKKGDFVSALKKYIDIQTNDSELNFNKYHNSGNTYYRLAENNNLDKKLLLNSLQNYSNALEIKYDEKTEFNYNFVLEKLQDNKENGENTSNQLSSEGEEEEGLKNNNQGEILNEESKEENNYSENTNGKSENNTSSNQESGFSQKDLDFLKEYEQQLIEDQVRYSEGFNKKYNEKNDIFDNFFDGFFFDNSSLNQENKKNW